MKTRIKVEENSNSSKRFDRRKSQVSESVRSTFLFNPGIIEKLGQLRSILKTRDEDGGSVYSIAFGFTFGRFRKFESLPSDLMLEIENQIGKYNLERPKKLTIVIANKTYSDLNVLSERSGISRNDLLSFAIESFFSEILRLQAEKLTIWSNLERKLMLLEYKFEELTKLMESFDETELNVMKMDFVNPEKSQKSLELFLHKLGISKIPDFENGYTLLFDRSDFPLDKQLSVKTKFTREKLKQEIEFVSKLTQSK